MQVHMIEPKAKPRMTRRDRWKPSAAAQAYWEWKDRLRALGPRLRPGDGVIFYRPMPKSWSKRRRAEEDGTPQLGKPDRDNYDKGLLDALFEDDAHLWDACTVQKRWGKDGAIVILEPEEVYRIFWCLRTSSVPLAELIERVDRRLR